MFRFLIHWLLTAIALMIVCRLVTGYQVEGTQSALEAAVAIGLLNGILGYALKTIRFPFAIIAFSLFMVLINAAAIMLASQMVGGFTVFGWDPALWGAAILSSIGFIVRAVSKE
ncbi:MAG: phage holin family protein [Terracidiphilus sp.]